MPKIVVHCLVKNEERFIWYALNSVLPFVDRIMVWDTASTDSTVARINSITSRKISFRQAGPVDPDSFTKVRNQMLKSTPSDFDWLMILDGDEIWPQSSIKTATDFCKDHPDYESVVVRTRNLVGDVHHALPESSGRYHLAGHTGHLNLRFMHLKNIPGLHVARPHGQQGYFDAAETLIQNRDPQKIKFLDVYYHHATHLVRSRADAGVMKRTPKHKFELGQKLSDLPEIYSAPRPDSIPAVTTPAPLSFWLKAAAITPLRRLRRLVMPIAHGY